MNSTNSTYGPPPSEIYRSFQCKHKLAWIIHMLSWKQSFSNCPIKPWDFRSLDTIKDSKKQTIFTVILLVDSCDQLVSTFIINHVHQTAMQTDSHVPIECIVLLPWQGITWNRANSSYCWQTAWSCCGNGGNRQLERKKNGRRDSRFEW